MQVHLTRLDLVVVGAPSKEYAAALADYEKRLSRYVRLGVHEVKGEALQRGEAQVLAAEERRLAAAIDSVERSAADRTFIVACDRAGSQLSTEELASQLLGERSVCLVVGGAFGIPEPVLRRAQLRVSFGRITMPHQLARLVATEQLYRSFRIARGEPYHY